MSTAKFSDLNGAACLTDSSPPVSAQCQALVVTSTLDNCFIRQCKNSSGLRTLTVVDALSKREVKVPLCTVHSKKAEVSEMVLPIWFGPAAGYRAVRFDPRDEASLAERIEAAAVLKAFATNKAERVRRRLYMDIMECARRERVAKDSLKVEQSKHLRESTAQKEEIKTVNATLDGCLRDSQQLSEWKEAAIEEWQTVAQNFKAEIDSLRETVTGQTAALKTCAAELKQEQKNHEETKRMAREAKALEAELKEKEEVEIYTETERKTQEGKLIEQQNELKRQIAELQDAANLTERRLAEATTRANEEKTWKDRYQAKLKACEQKGKT